MNKKTIYLQLNYKIGEINSKEIFKARILSDGTYSIKDYREVINLDPLSDAITILEEGNASQEEINEYFENPLGKRYIIRQGIDEDKKKCSYRMSLETLQNILHRCKEEGNFFEIDWGSYVTALEFFDKEFKKNRYGMHINMKDPFFGNESHAIASILSMLVIDTDKDNLDRTLNEIEEFVSTWKEEKEKRRYTERMLVSIASYFYDGEYFDLENHPEELPFADKIANVLNDKYKNRSALATIATNHYTGTALEEPNYPLAEKELNILLKTGDAYAANTLGYLTLYHGGKEKIDYDKAFRYFSTAAVFDIPEAKLKMADLLCNEECSAYNPRIVPNIYVDLYKRGKIKFIHGDEEDSKFSDVLLRLYNVQHDPIFGDKWNDEEGAIACILQASLAIKKRISQHPNYVGDISVANRISSILESIPRQEEIKETYSILTQCDCDETLGQLPSRYINDDLLIKDVDINDGYVTFTIAPSYAKETFGKLLYEDEIATVVAPPFARNMYGLFALPRMKRAFVSDRLRFSFKLNSSFFKKKKEIFIKDIYLSPIDNSALFKLSLRFEEGEKTFLVKDPKIILPTDVLNEKMVNLVSVTFSKNGKTYDYLCDDDVSIDDVVYVPTKRGMQEVTVVGIKEMYPSELALPEENYKKASKNLYYYS